MKIDDRWKQVHHHDSIEDHDTRAAHPGSGREIVAREIGQGDIELRPVSRELHIDRIFEDRTVAGTHKGMRTHRFFLGRENRDTPRFRLAHMAFDARFAALGLAVLLARITTEPYFIKFCMLLRLIAT